MSSNQANSTCVGPQSDQAGKADSCAGCPNQSTCASGEAKNAADNAAAQFVKDRMASVKHKILILSGKGGVGKSTFSAQLAFTLAAQGKQVGLLDIDICGPSIPRMLGLQGHEVHQSASGWSPVYVEENLAVMSIGFMLPSKDDAIIWRGPRKNGLIKQFLTDVVWSDLDYLIIDTPPGTSDEHISIVQYLKGTRIDGAVVITTPQEVSMDDVRKEINFCKKTGVPVLGVVENMADIALPLSLLSQVGGGVKLITKQGEDVSSAMLDKIRSLIPELLDLSLQSQLFMSSPPAALGSCAPLSTPLGMCKQFNVPYLGRLPLDPQVTRACEDGKSFLEVFPDSPAAAPFSEVVQRLVDIVSRIR